MSVSANCLRYLLIYRRNLSNRLPHIYVNKSSATWHRRIISPWIRYSHQKSNILYQTVFMFSVRYKYQWASFRISAPIAHIFALPRWYNSSHIAIIAGLNLMSHNDARLSFARILGGPIFIPLTSDWSTWILFNWHYSGKDSGLFCCFEMIATQNDLHIQTQQKTNRFYWHQ